MAKKQKRRVSQGTTSAPIVSKPVVSRSVSSTTSEFNPDYSNIKKDLKRIATLAGSFFVILVALSFIIK
ncbi:MAG: hypothetical protein M1281_18140 [Chloroflexi bacterium]|nr:hypothetical protein [Chloroflexota bacterium]